MTENIETWKGLWLQVELHLAVLPEQNLLLIQQRVESTLTPTITEIEEEREQEDDERS